MSGDCRRNLFYRYRRGDDGGFDISAIQYDREPEAIKLCFLLFVRFLVIYVPSGRDADHEVSAYVNVEAVL